jgi:hypothetical protein
VLGLLKVIVVMAVMATIGGLAVHWAKDQTSAAIHRAVDTSLPDEVSAHPWAPLRHGGLVHTARVRFSDGRITPVRCHAAPLGTYSVSITHSFTFTRATTFPKARCPGRRLAVALRHATRVDFSTAGSVDTLTFSDRDGHPVATLQGRHR